MRFLVVAGLILAFPSRSFAQENGAPVTIALVRVGFQSCGADEAPSRFKVGLWAPIAVDLQAGPDGLKECDLAVETVDCDNAGSIYTVHVPAMAKNERRTFVTYSKPGNSDGRFTVSIRAGGKDVIAPLAATRQALDLRARLYLSLGANLPDLAHALLALLEPGREGQAKRNSWPRFAGFETDPRRLPDLALGYDAVDLIVLNTGNADFLNGLTNDARRVQAIAQWVRQGGRLVIGVSPGRQKALSMLMSGPGWQPPLPVVPPAEEPEISVKRLLKVEEWANITDKPFPDFGEPPVPVAVLQSPKVQRPEWEVQADTGDGLPLITQMPYGRGSVTLLAFDLESGPFAVWEGRTAFLKALVYKLEPRVPPAYAGSEAGQAGSKPGAGNDFTTQLQISLDRFNVPIIPFGLVALLIVVYILIVGPLDYFLLKNVFKRLEWTWVTFPMLVVVVSVAVYWIADQVKAKELQINQVDVIDLDLRTELDNKQQTKKAYAYGNTWFTILSPRIQSYDIQVEPNLGGWWPESKTAKPRAAVSWLGRPEYDGPGAMGRPRLQGLSHRAYYFGPHAAEMKNVPIPIGTTKSFTASWEAPLPRLPIAANLAYQLEKDVKVTGSIQSFLPGDLEDVWIFYRDRVYPLEGPLSGSAEGGAVRKIALGINSQEIQGWARRVDESQDEAAVPRRDVMGPLFKEVLFHEHEDSGLNRRNQAMLRLDMSWRLPKPKVRQSNVHDAILFGRLKPGSRPPTSLRLRAGQPGAPDITTRETFIRVILPVKSAEE